MYIVSNKEQTLFVFFRLALLIIESLYIVIYLVCGIEEFCRLPSKYLAGCGQFLAEIDINLSFSIFSILSNFFLAQTKNYLFSTITTFHLQQILHQVKNHNPCSQSIMVRLLVSHVSLFVIYITVNYDPN